VDKIDPQARRGRWAMTAMFLANGFIVGSWAPHIPLLIARLNISETTLGILILLFGVGALIAMPTCGYLMTRHRSRAVLRAFAMLSCVALLLVALASPLWLAAIAMIFLGGTIGGMDVAMNTNAVAVEKRLGRAIMSSSHGFWSLGGFFGAALGGLAIQGLGYLTHAALVTAILVVVVGTAQKWLIAEEEHSTAPNQADEPQPFSWPRNPLIYLVGFVALFSMIPEGAVLDWAALYLQQELGSEIAVAGFAFAAFSVTMATMRFLGDHVRNRFGAVSTFRVSALIAATGMVVAGLADSAGMAIAAFAFAGLGIANMVPIAFSAAGNQPDVATATGMSVVTTMGYSGILVAPSALGFIGERVGFWPIYVALAGFLLVLSLMAGLVRSADFAKSSAQ
jgi:predicted MFS family arabinose efflux permease